MPAHFYTCVAGAADVPSASNAPVANASARDTSESLRLSKKQRQAVEQWLQASQGAVAHTAPVLLPGPPLLADGSADGLGQGGGAGGDAPGGSGGAPARGRWRKGGGQR